jgi:hypothetical protein
LLQSQQRRLQGGLLLTQLVHAVPLKPLSAPLIFLKINQLETVVNKLAATQNLLVSESGGGKGEVPLVDCRRRKRLWWKKSDRLSVRYLDTSLSRLHTQATPLRGEQQMCVMSNMI